MTLTEIRAHAAGVDLYGVHYLPSMSLPSLNSAGIS